MIPIIFLVIGLCFALLVPFFISTAEGISLILYALALVFGAVGISIFTVQWYYGLC